MKGKLLNKVEIIVTKEEITQNLQFSIFQQCFKSLNVSVCWKGVIYLETLCFKHSKECLNEMILLSTHSIGYTELIGEMLWGNNHLFSQPY